MEHFHEFLSKCKYPATLSMNETTWGIAIKPYLELFIKKKRTNKCMAYRIKVGDMRCWLVEKKYLMDCMIQDDDDDDY